MARKQVFVLLLISTTALARANYYCEIDCGDHEHIGCNKQKALGPACPKDAEIYEFSKQDIDLWLKLDNDRRNQIANGSLPGYKSASRMPRTTWNTELATLALYNAESCVYGHDKCRNTEDYKYAGQNIALIGVTGGYFPTEEAIQKVHDAWFNEYKDASMKEIESFPKNPSKEIGHFTQIVRDKSPQFGCAATKYKKNRFYYWYIVCDYGTTNIIDYPVYKSGTACSACESGCDEIYPALCRSNEPIRPNNF